MRRALLAVALPWKITPWPSAAPPAVDGRLDEPGWQSIPAYEEFYQVLPEPGPVPYKTRVRLTRDAAALYIAIEMEDPAGERQSHITGRDRINGTDDMVTVVLDTTGTRAFGQYFSVNPDCSINDGDYVEASLSWYGAPDYSFSVGCQAQKDGWTVEYRIPWHELRYTGGQQNPWIIVVERAATRDQNRTAANAPRPRNVSCILCDAPPLEAIGDLPNPTFYKATPYAVARHADKDEFHAGIDAKYRLNSDAILDLTVNPDFSQVSPDEPQLSANTNFAIATSENRPFFLEGTDLIDSPMKVIHTRSIQQPSWGMKYTQRSQHQDTMVLAGDDQTQNSVLIAGPYGSRLRPIHAIQKFAMLSTHWKEPDYNLGLSLTNRQYEDLGANQTLGFDGMHYLSKEDSIRWQSIFTASTNRWDSEAAAFRKGAQQDGAAQYMILQHRGETWVGSLEMKASTDDFRTDLGFNPRNAYQLGIVTNSYHQNFGETHVEYYLVQAQKIDLDRRLMERQNTPGVTVTGFHGLTLWFEPRVDMNMRVRSNGALHHYKQYDFGFVVYPGLVISSIDCDVTLGQRIDVREDRVRQGRSESCTINGAIGKRLEWKLNLGEEVMPDVLVNQTLNSVIVLPLSNIQSLHYIHQEDRIDRTGEGKSFTQTDSLNIAHENHEGFTAYLGASHVRTTGETRETQREYYIKISQSLP